MERIELIIRDIFISFCIAAYFMSFTTRTLPDLIKWNLFGIPIIGVPSGKCGFTTISVSYNKN